MQGTTGPGSFDPRLPVRKAVGVGFVGLFILALLIGLSGLTILIIQVLIEGVPWLSWTLLSSYQSRFPDQAGLLAPLIGSLWLMALTAAFTVPVGVGAAVYLEEYAPKNRLTQIIEVNISNLAGVPSIVYGLLGLAVFVQWMAMGRSLLAGGLTLSLLVLPIVILTSREAIRAVPQSYRQGAYALGSTQWQVTKKIVLPAAFPGILTGVILAMSRAVGEAAPILAITALVYVTFVPSNPLDRFTILPLQIFDWVGRPQEDFQALAAAGIIILLAVLLSMNALAIYLRNKYQKRSEE